MAVRDEVHALVDALPESELPAVRRYLKSVATVPKDPLIRFFQDAPDEDEPISPEEERAVAEGREDIRLGRTVSMEEAKRILRS